MSDRARNSLGQLVSKPLQSLRNATEYLRDHATAKYHLHSVAQANEFVNRYLHPAKDIDRLLLTADEQQQRENRAILVSIVQCLLFLAKQNLAIRGADDDGLPDEDNKSQGNFRELILFRIEAGDAVLDKHLKTTAKNACYLSPRIQNEIFSISAKCVRNELLRELIDSKSFYSILADETSDVSRIEQLSITIRFLSKKPEMTIKEVFVGFVPVRDLTAKGIAQVLLNSVRSIGLSVDKIRGEPLPLRMLDVSVFHVV